jgi:hypothetical protein
MIDGKLVQSYNCSSRSYQGARIVFGQGIPSLRVGQIIRLDGKLKHVQKIEFVPQAGIGSFRIYIVYELCDGEPPPPPEWISIYRVTREGKTLEW